MPKNKYELTADDARRMLAALQRIGDIAEAIADAGAGGDDNAAIRNIVAEFAPLGDAWDAAALLLENAAQALRELQHGPPGLDDLHERMQQYAAELHEYDAGPDPMGDWHGRNE